MLEWILDAVVVRAPMLCPTDSRVGAISLEALDPFSEGHKVGGLRRKEPKHGVANVQTRARSLLAVSEPDANTCLQEGLVTLLVDQVRNYLAVALIERNQLRRQRIDRIQIHGIAIPATVSDDATVDQV